MNPKLAILKMVPRAQPLEMRVDGSAGDGKGLTGLDVAAATAGVPMGYVRLLQAKFTGDPGNHTKLLEWLEAVCWLIARRRHYKIRGEEARATFSKIVEVVYWGVVSPGNCHGCLGRGWVMREKLWVECPTCNGERKLKIQAGEIRKMTGITRSQWDSKWRRIHDGLTRELQAGLRGALEKIGARLNGDEN